MPEQRNRIPWMDLAKHIINGRPLPQTGEGIVRDIDNEWIDHGDPMGPYTADVGDGNFLSQPTADIQAASTAQAVGLASGAAFGEEFSVAEMSSNSGGAGGGPSGSTYGPRSTGKGH